MDDYTKKILNLKNSIEEEIKKINKAFDKTINEIKNEYKKKNEIILKKKKKKKKK